MQKDRDKSFCKCNFFFRGRLQSLSGKYCILKSKDKAGNSRYSDQCLVEYSCTNITVDNFTGEIRLFDTEEIFIVVGHIGAADAADKRVSESCFNINVHYVITKK